MKRSNSLDLISRNSPTSILRVSLNKVQQLFDQETRDEKDYKKIMCWLKIASTASQSLNRTSDFHKYLAKLPLIKNRSDSKVSQILLDLFPAEKDLWQTTTK